MVWRVIIWVLWLAIVLGAMAGYDHLIHDQTGWVGWKCSLLAGILVMAIVHIGTLVEEFIDAQTPGN